jgi:hypothetical protein
MMGAAEFGDLTSARRWPPRQKLRGMDEGQRHGTAPLLKMPAMIRHVLLALLAIPSLLPAQEVRMTRLVDVTTQIPGLGQVTGIGRSAMQGNQVLIHLWTAAGDAIVLLDLPSNVFTVIADSNTILPSQGVPTDFYASPALHAGRAFFLGSTTVQYKEELVEGMPGPSLRSLSGGGFFTRDTSTDGASVTYSSGVGDALSLIRHDLAGGTNHIIAIRNALIPGGQGNFWEILSHTIAAGQTVFGAYVTNAATSTMLFHHDAATGTLRTLVDSSVNLPVDGRPIELVMGGDHDGETYLFFGGTRYPLFGGWHGLYRGRLSGGPLDVIVDLDDVVPSGTETFMSLGATSLGAGVVYFTGGGYTDFGVLAWTPGGAPFWLARVGQTIGGMPITDAWVLPQFAEGNRSLVQVSYANYTQALYLAETLTLGVEGPLVRGSTGSLDARGLAAGERAYFAMSRVGPGAGPCPGALGGRCLNLLAPTLIGSAVAGADGDALMPLRVPPGAPIGKYWFQAAVSRGAGGGSSALTNVASVEVR